MNVNLICSDQLKSIMKELLNNRGINIDASSKIDLVEKSFNHKSDKVTILFDLSTIDDLMSFLDGFKKEKDNIDVFTGKDEDGYEVLNYGDIYYFEGLGNNVYAVDSNKRLLVKDKLYEIEERLRNHGFIRVSKAFIVNVSKIDRIQPWFNGKLILKMDKTTMEIDVTRTYVKSFKSYLGL